MKRWYISCGEVGYVSSLQSLAGAAKIAQFKSDCGKTLIVQFLRFYDFSKGKAGSEQSAWLKIHGDKHSTRCKIVFK